MPELDKVRKSSPMLYAFYKDWYEWATTEAPDSSPFRRCHGLCANLEYWFMKDEYLKHGFDKTDDEIETSVILEMQEQFIDAGLSQVYPFGEQNYDICGSNRRQHTDPQRLDWVAARIAEGVHEEKYPWL